MSLWSSVIDIGFSSFNATAGPKVSRLKITVADQRGWIKCYVSDPNLDTKLIENKSVMVKNFYINDGIVRISQKAYVTVREHSYTIT